MPNKQSHLVAAGRSQAALECLQASPDGHPEWVAVIAFYKALHIVDAVLFVDHPARHGGSHEDRKRLLKTTNKYRKIYDHYRILFTASLVARYLEAEGTEYRSFTDYMSAERVQSELIRHDLHQLQKAAEKIIGPVAIPPRTTAAPPPVPPAA